MNPGMCELRPTNCGMFCKSGDGLVKRQEEAAAGDVIEMVGGGMQQAAALGSRKNMLEVFAGGTGAVIQQSLPEHEHGALPPLLPSQNTELLG